MRRPQRYPGRMLAKIPDEKRRREVERSYERIENRVLFRKLSEDKKMSETTYIERYWRDAKPEDAIKEPPMVARFRTESSDEWRMDTLQGIDRSDRYKWRGRSVVCRFCQVYDAPDPGEGWRLIDTANEKLQEGDEFLNKDDTWVRSLNKPLEGFGNGLTYRRRITPTVTYVPFTWEDREQLRGRWIVSSKSSSEAQCTTIYQSEEGVLYVDGRSTQTLVEHWKFLDTGEPVGKKVTQ